MAVAVVGSINCDVIVYVARLPRPGETLVASACRLGLGGKGANQAVAARRLGSAVSLIGRVGDDAFGQAVLGELHRFALDTTLVALDRDGATGMAMIHVGADGENTIAILAGGNGALGKAELEEGRAAIQGARVLLLQLEVPLATSLAAAALVRAAGGLAILDPAPAPAGGLGGEVLAAIDILTPNETETAALTGALPRSADDGIAAARALRARGVGTAIVKLGARGAAFSGPSGEGFQPAFPVAAIDSVAAGDCFNGALAHLLAQGSSSLADAVRFAAAAGALSTTRMGAADAAPSLIEVERLLSGVTA
jgi:ribokinase